MSASGAPTTGGTKKARIEIIPLIDVIFFLLATFVLFTLSLDRIKSIDVTLPKAAPASNRKPDEDLVTLQVSDINTYYWKVGTGGSEQLTLNDLRPKLELFKQTANPRILVTGDNLARFGATVRALDEIRAAGIEQVSVETSGARQTGK